LPPVAERMVGISTAVAFAVIDLFPALGAAEVDDMRKLLVHPMKDSPSQVEKPTFFLWIKAYYMYTDTDGSISL